MKNLIVLFLLSGFLMFTSSCNNASSKGGASFDLTGYDSENMGGGITYVSKRNADGKLLEEGYLLNNVRNGSWLTYAEDGIRVTGMKSYVNG